MPKKYPPGYKKDPKKVAAGKARAAKSVRIKGQFVRNDFIDQIEKDAKAAGAKDPFKFFLQREKHYEKIYLKEQVELTRNVEQLRVDIKKFKGKIKKNGKEVKPATLIKSLAQLGQYLENEQDLYHIFFLNPKVSMSGVMNIQIPSITEIDRRIDNGEDIIDIMDSYGITVMDGKGEKQN